MSEVVTRYRNDPRIVAAVRLVISDIQRSVAPAIAESRFFERWEAIRAEDAEAPAERWRRENTEGLRLIAAFGNVRGAALKAAQRVYPNNPGEHHRVAQRFRRLLRQQK
jgi:post-segregation antitoxin (ccd killing protein)